ncbi:hypothetical protein DNH61_13010 [Paenibacillus sambharensis]|uniref:GGDEF domain-containing protein n=1 Tax=Paenibacillus sambharensis TaxID=1803190 RepID=A0A2W1L5P4_9BACL|nr:EAL domain-containing protein [Paenibacillus sambharensis]PZD95448.1 hypothetical protein DNH61_13010 [Paenibacillus sambharensis]
MFEWPVFINLLRNAADIGFFIFLVNYIRRYMVHLNRTVKLWAWGLLFGLAGLVSMQYPITVSEGVIVDFRVVLVAMASLYGGARGALLSALLIAAGRYYLGGAGFIPGIGTVITAALLGLLARWYEQKNNRRMSNLQLLGLGFLLALQMLPWVMLLPRQTVMQYLQYSAIPVFILFPLTVLLFCHVMAGQFRVLSHPFLEISNLKHISTELQRYAGGSSQTAVAFAQIDNFKNLNHLYGYALGEQLLIQMYDRIRSRFGDPLLIRYGMGEFVMCLKNLDNIQGSLKCELKKIKQELMQPYRVHGMEINLTLTAGVAVGAARKDSVETMLRQAETALHEARKKGQNHTIMYEPSMADKSVHFSQIQEALRSALSRGEISLHLQPQFNTDTSLLRGFEALVRWNHPRLGPVSPADFIPIAEQNGTIIEIGEWVLRQACEIHLKELLPLFPEALMSVNISAVQLGDPDFAAGVVRILEETGLPPDRLELEITESGLMASVESAAETMTQLEKLGIRFALDDFGTGYSSLNYLQKFPIHLVKIDKSFIHDLSGRQNKSRMTESIINFVHMLNLPVVAEGLETDEQLTLLRDWRCDFVQGYLFSRPIPAGEAPAYVRRILNQPSPVTP